MEGRKPDARLAASVGHEQRDMRMVGSRKPRGVRRDAAAPAGFRAAPLSRAAGGKEKGTTA